MALVRWNPTMPWRPSQESWSPFTGMESLRAEMEHLFNSFLGSMPSSGTQESLWYPRVDLREHDQEFVLVADLPGMKQEDINITVENNILTLQGKRIVEHRAENGQNGYAHYSERAFGTFCRRFTLGAAVDADQITATYKPTVSLGVTCLVVYTYGCGDGRIWPTRCAVIGLFAIIWAGSKSFHNRLISVFSGCVHFVTQRPAVESA
jgi:HSP20 family protein